jgi:hypothetical protein
MRCPFATWEPVVNETNVAIAHVGVVIHVTAGESNPWGWFNNPAAQASSHFFIGNGQGGTPDGALFQYVDTDQKAWAEAAGNTSYISVETEGVPEEALTQAQILTFGRLYAWCHEAYGIPLVLTDSPGAAGFITHGDGGQAWGGHLDCPGPLRSPQRSAILFIAALVLNPTPGPTLSEEDTMIAYDPDSGGFWATDPKGDTANYNGAPFIAGLNSHPDWHAGQTESGGTNKVVGLSTFKDKHGAHGLVWQVAPEAGASDVTQYSYYRIARDGTPD